MDDVLKYKPYLKEFDYPNFYTFSDEEILDIFTAKNRRFLLTWLAKKINSEFAVPSEWSKSSEELFAEFFNDSGFCRSSEKLAFVRGSENLTGKKLMDIFDRIFNFLQNSSQDDNVEPVLNVSEEDAQSKDITGNIELLLKKDINLFPMFGPLKLRTAEEKQKKNNYYKQEIEKLQQNLNLCNDDEIDYEQFCNDVQEEEIARNIETFRKQAGELQKAASVACVHDKSEESGDKIGFKFNVEKQLSECNSEIKVALQYAKTVHSSQLVNTPELQDLHHSGQDEIYEICEQQAQDSFELVKRMDTINSQK